MDNKFVVVQKTECDCKIKGCNQSTWMTLWAPDFDFTYKGTCRIIGIFSANEASKAISKETGNLTGPRINLIEIPDQIEKYEISPLDGQLVRISVQRPDRVIAARIRDKMRRNMASFDEVAKILGISSDQLRLLSIGEKYTVNEEDVDTILRIVDEYIKQPS